MRQSFKNHQAFLNRLNNIEKSIEDRIAELSDDDDNEESSSSTSSLTVPATLTMEEATASTAATTTTTTTDRQFEGVSSITPSCPAAPSKTSTDVILDLILFNSFGGGENKTSSEFTIGEFFRKCGVVVGSAAAVGIGSLFGFTPVGRAVRSGGLEILKAEFPGISPQRSLFPC